MVIKDFFIRNLDSDNYRENFLISAIVSLFVIRIYLRLTNYPHIGGESLHIAHMLWGGFIMVAAILILLTFLSKTSMNIASILGGIGFGTFIDELGKFISKDNNYFFRPTIAFIYIIFVLIYLLIKFIPKYREPTQKEYLVNAIEMIKESAINDFDEEEERQSYEYLRNCDPKNPIVQALTRLLSRIDAVPISPPSLFTRLRIGVRNWYYTIAKSDLIIKIIIFYLAFQTIDTIVNTIVLSFAHPLLPFDEWGKLYSSGLAAIFVMIGLFALKFSKTEAYRFFRIAMLITLLMTQFFSFMHGGWIELIPLAANIFMLLVINYAATMEKQKRTKLHVPAENS
jgi:hypothetical protein